MSKTTVSTTPECAWSASANAAWIGLSPSSGQGSADIQVQVAANPSPVARQTEITLNDTKTVVSQSAAPCAFTIDTRSQVVAAGGGSGTITVTTLAGCAWTASSTASWLSITSGATGNGPGVVRYSVEGNTGGARLGTIAIADQTVSVTQPGADPSCVYTIQPTVADVSADGETRAVAIGTTPSCSWAAASNAAWLSVAGGATGVGAGSVTIVAAPNTGAARSGTLTIAGQTFTVNQSAGGGGGCGASISPSTASMPATGAAGPPVVVSIAAGCPWTATSAASWISISAGASGTGSGSVAFSVLSNSGSARTGTIAIAGQTFTVTQAGVCAFTVNPTSYAAPATGGPGPTVTVSSSSSCRWTATSSASWITVTAGATGTGNGAVTFTVAANSGSARTGSLEIAGTTFIVTQAGNCAATLAPASQSLTPTGGPAAPVTVSIASGCAWTATTSTPWINLSGSASGVGNGTVQFSVSGNPGQARTGSIVVLGQTHTVNQAGGCSVTITPASSTSPVLGGAGTPIGVAASGGCAWTAVSTVPWITVTGGANGTGNGSVSYSVSANLGLSRTGTIVIGDKTFTVNQNGLLGDGE